MKAIWDGVVLADSDETIIVEGNHYFPPDSVRREFLEPSDMRTACSWKGEASYYDIVVDGKHNPNGAWYYPEPSEQARQMKDYVAFWHGVTVMD